MKAKDVDRNIIRIFDVNLGLQPDENCLILSDIPNEKEVSSKELSKLIEMFNRVILARRFYDLCFKNVTRRVKLKVFPSTGISGSEPPSDVSNLMLDFDVIVILTTYSLSHTNARKNACLNGSRVVSMPGFTVDMLRRGGPMDVDYIQVSRLTRKIADLGSKAVNVTIKYGGKFSFKFDKRGRVFHVDDGLYTSPGSFGNLPAGEAFCAPLEGTAEGEIYVRKGWYPGLRTDMVVNVENGYVASIKGGGKVGGWLRELLGFIRRELDSKINHRRNIAEFGIGTNHNASRTDNVLESEKIKGTVHVAIGDNINFGGLTTSDIHLDFILPEVDLYFDDKMVMRKGKLAL